MDFSFSEEEEAVRDLAKQVSHAVDPGPSLVVGVHDEPWRLGDVGVHEHLVLGPRVVHPPRAREHVGG